MARIKAHMARIKHTTHAQAHVTHAHAALKVYVTWIRPEGVCVELAQAAHAVAGLCARCAWSVYDKWPSLSCPRHCLPTLAACKSLCVPIPAARKTARVHAWLTYAAGLRCRASCCAFVHCSCRGPEATTESNPCPPHALILRCMPTSRRL